MIVKLISTNLCTTSIAFYILYYICSSITKNLNIFTAGGQVIYYILNYYYLYNNRYAVKNKHFFLKTCVINYKTPY